MYVHIFDLKKKYLTQFHSLLFYLPIVKRNMYNTAWKKISPINVIDIRHTKLFLLILWIFYKNRLFSRLFSRLTSKIAMSTIFLMKTISAEKKIFLTHQYNFCIKLNCHAHEFLNFYMVDIFESDF